MALVPYGYHVGGPYQFLDDGIDERIRFIRNAAGVAHRYIYPHVRPYLRSAWDYLWSNDQVRPAIEVGRSAPALEDTIRVVNRGDNSTRVVTSGRTTGTDRAAISRHQPMFARHANASAVTPAYSSISDRFRGARHQKKINKMLRNGGFNYAGRNLSYGGTLDLQTKLSDAYIAYGELGSGNWEATTTGNLMDPDDLHLTPVTLGTGYNNRVSNRVLIKSLQITGFIGFSINRTVNPGAGADTHPATLSSNWKVRLALVLDQQTNGAGLTTSEVYTGSTILQLALRNPDFFDKYRVLKTWDFPVEMALKFFRIFNAGVYDSWTGSGSVAVDLFYPCGIVQKYEVSATDGAVSGVVDNSLHLVMFITGDGDNGLLAQTTLNVNLSVRTRFHDQ